jgi:thiaminase/transcriptional activator TenA
MSFAHELQQRFAPLFAGVQAHPFVAGIGDGTLPVERFRFYIEQDYVFLVEYSRVLALAVAKGRDLPGMGQFAELLHATLNVEMALHRGYAAKFGITPEALARVTAAPTTYAYTRHLLAVAYAGSIAEIGAALLPCQWGYGEIGRGLAVAGPPADQPLYAEWIAMYAGAEYHELVERLIATFDALAAQEGDAGRARLAEIFRISSHYEWAFWEMSWRQERWRNEG